MLTDCLAISSPVLAEVNLPSRYSDVELIGEGATCLVFRAQDNFLDRTVAIKYMRPDIGDLRRIRRFQQEARVLSSFRTVHLPVVLDFGLSPGGHPYMVMEFLEGSSLAEVLCERGPLDADLCIEITIQILSALIHAHERGIIHRDLKSDNVMITWIEDDLPLVKVLDFGIATSSTSASQILTRAGSFVGTPLYVSPEQASGGRVDARSDIYSVGCIMFELLTGRTPFVGECLMDTLDAHVRAEPPSLRSMIEGEAVAINELESILLKSLEKKPAKRFQTAEEFQMVLMAVHDRLCEPLAPGKRFLDTLAHIDRVSISLSDPASSDQEDQSAQPAPKGESDVKELSRPWPLTLHVVSFLTCCLLIFLVVNLSVSFVLAYSEEVRSPARSEVQNAASHRSRGSQKPDRLFSGSYPMPARFQESWARGLRELYKKEYKNEFESAPILLNKETHLSRIGSSDGDSFGSTESEMRDWSYIYESKFHVQGKAFYGMPNLSDGELGLIGKFPKITKVNLVSSAVSGSGLHALEQLPIQILDLRARPITEEGFAAIAKMKNLQELHLDYMPFLTADKVCLLQQSRSLKLLSCIGTVLDKDAQSEIAKIASLQSIILDDARGVDDSTLSLMLKMPSLKRLSIGKSCSKISPQGIAAFQRLRPDVLLR